MNDSHLDGPRSRGAGEEAKDPSLVTPDKTSQPPPAAGEQAPANAEPGAASAIVAEIRSLAERYRDCTPHPYSRAAYLLRHGGALEVIGDEAAAALIRECETHGMDWGPALLTLAERVRARGRPAVGVTVTPDEITEAVAAGTGTGGASLFAEVRSVLKRYLHWPQEWEYDLGALWVFQAYVPEILPSVFYVFFSATKGRGKTTALDVLAGLTGALNASNISVAALVHALKAAPGRAVCCDEFDVARDAERDSALASIARDGYTPGKPYLRWDPVHKAQDECPTFGAKAFGFRGNVDDGLEDRGFTLPLPTVSLRGREGAKLVLRNYRRDFSDLALRLTRWAAERKKRGLPEVTTEAWLGRIEEVVGAEACGANRETQLAGVVLAVGDAVGVDVTESLRAALGLRREVAEANVDLGVEEAREILEKMIGETETLTKEAEFHVIRQREFADALNARRRERHERPLTSSQVAKLRNDLGIDPAWLTHSHNRVTWNIPAREWDRRRGLPNPPNPPNPHGGADRVRRVSQVSQGPPEPPSGPTPHQSQTDLDGVREVRDGGVAPSIHASASNPEGNGGGGGGTGGASGGQPGRDPEGLLGSELTLATKALANARVNGSLPQNPREEVGS